MGGYSNGEGGKEHELRGAVSGRAHRIYPPLLIPPPSFLLLTWQSWLTRRPTEGKRPKPTVRLSFFALHRERERERGGQGNGRQVGTK